LHDLVSQEPELISVEQHVIVTVLGADELLGIRLNEPKSAQEQFFFSAQWTREGLRDFKFPILIWLTPEIASSLAQQAPDFWSWRGGVFEFSQAILTNKIAEKIGVVVQTGRVNIQSYGFGDNIAGDKIVKTLAEPMAIKRQIDELQLQDPNSPLLASLYNRLGNIYKDAIQYSDAEESYLKSLKLYERLQIRDHPDVPDILSNLAYIYQSQGKESESKSLYLQALSISQSALANVSASGDIEIGNIEQIVHYYTLKGNKSIPSNVRQGIPDFTGRVEDLQRLHEALQKNKIVVVQGTGGVGKTELVVQYTLSQEFHQCYVACYWFLLNEGNLASLVLQKSAPYLAMPEEIQKSNDIYEQVKWCWQNWHPLEGEVLVILDDVKSLDDIPERVMPMNPRFKVILTTRQRNLSPFFPQLALDVLSEAEALELFKKIVDQDGSSRIEDELDAAKEICSFLGYLPLAIQLAGAFLVENAKLSLSDYSNQLLSSVVKTASRIASSLKDLAWLYKSQSKYDEAEVFYVRALEITEQQLGREHPDVAEILDNLAVLYEVKGKYREAELTYIRLAQICEINLGVDHPKVAQSLNILANLYCLQEKFTEAEPLYIRALEIVETSLGNEDPTTNTIRENLQHLRDIKESTTKLNLSMGGSPSMNEN
jgi:tetratricopeptide (TPR) repeat protein